MKSETLELMKAEIKKHLTSQDPVASVLVLHGYAEHQGRYTHVIDALREAGFDVYTYDQYGHGTAPGPRAKVDVGGLIKDHVEARKQVAAMMRTSDLFLFGHSMGGLVTAASNLVDPSNVRGVVLSGPAFDATGGMDPEIVRKVAKATLLMPGGTPTTALNPEDLASDPKVVEDYKTDPLNYHGKVPAKTAGTLMVQGLETMKRASRWQNPLIIFHGSDDVACNPAASWHFAQEAGTGGASVEMIEVPGAKHEVFNEPTVSAMLLETMVMWMNSQIRRHEMGNPNLYG
ncbi:MAG: alpha/beta hydrolase [Actinomycetaceae bacterium]|nr:alpha/beta hydrolase [Actinomycetaceae bacterium]